jgi:uncharacterized protein YecT (DUF1311 family)
VTPPLVLLALALSAAPQPAPGAEELEPWAAGTTCPPAEVRIERLAEHDFTGDGVPEAVVVVSTCRTGEGGAEVHVVTRGEDGKLAELPLPALEAGVFDGLVGPRSRTLAVREGLLVATWTDGTGREAPLVVRYRFAEGRFAADSVDRSPRYPTSYDCGRATRDLERGVCVVEPLAALDVALARAFATAVAKAPPPRRVVVRDAQARWLAERETRCGGTPGWVACLETSYRERLAELGAAAP